ncbi:hypothetical protein QRD38_18280, partial [Leptospira weilii]|nr:hypothetical protein [Leptospira weilii]
VYLEMIKFFNEGSIFRILLVLFSFFSFLLLAGVGFLWFKNPEIIQEILRTLSLKKSPEVIIEPGPQFHQVDLIRGLFSMSLD